MLEDNGKSLEERLLHYLDVRVYDVFLAYIKKNTRENADAKFKRINAFYGKALYDVAFDREPTLEQFSGMGFREPDESMFQAALYLYDKWKQMGLKGAVFNYCQYINRLMENKLFLFAPMERVMLPDYVNESETICEQIQMLKVLHASDLGKKEAASPQSPCPAR